MPEDARVQQLVEAALEGSRTPEEVCVDCPELLPAVARRLGQIQGLNVDLQILFPANVPTTPDNSRPKAIPPGLPTIEGYEILSVLGRGGMGVVYQARQNKLNRLVALKMILAGSHAGPADLARFQTEGEAIARLQHPNIVQVHEVGEHEGKPFFSLEFCGGGSLEKKLNGTPLPAREAAALVETLAWAMQAAHDKNIIHRDLKPANVLLTEDGTPKITDFGLARKLDEAGHTASGAIMGTPSYMSPEQAAGKSKEIGPATDVYALGAILYECLTGRPPFKAATMCDTIQQVLCDESVPPRRLNPQISHDLETICLKCLEKVPEKRYGSAEALAEDLARFQAGRPVQARPVGALERGWRWCRRNPAIAGLLAALVAVLLLGSGTATLFGVRAIQEAERAEEGARNAAVEAGNARAAEEEAQRKAEQAREAEGRAVAKGREAEQERAKEKQQRERGGTAGLRRPDHAGTPGMAARRSGPGLVSPGIVPVGPARLGTSLLVYPVQEKHPRRARRTGVRRGLQSRWQTGGQRRRRQHPQDLARGQQR